MRKFTSTATVLAFSLLLNVPVAQAANFVVNQTGSQGDDDAAAMGADDLVCDIDVNTAGNQCTLRAAIQEANDQTGIHNITFDNSITSITLSQALDPLTAPVNINGTTNNAGSGNRVEINGNNLGCFSLGETATAANANGARGSTLQNLVIRNCSGNAISLSGHGYTISGNRIGTNAAGSASDFNTDANDGDGISLSGTAAQPNAFPNVSALINDPPNNLGEIAAFVTALQAALTVIANPTFITNNLISGNKGDGIDLFTPSTVNVQINTNIIGLNQAGLTSVPNGRGNGDGAGIRMSGGAYGNVIGPGNIVSGQNEDSTDDGIVISGDVLVPNFVFGNLVGLGSAPGTDVGNGDIGLRIDTKPDTNGMGADNPTGFSLFVGPANTVSDNRSDNGGASLDAVNGDVSGGVVITGTSAGVRLYANIIGLGTFPAGGTPLGALEYGNQGNGIVITSGNNQIGGSEVFEANLILANQRHGILVRGSDVTNVRIQNNFIGASDPTGLGIFGFGNRGDGIYILDASSIKIGGAGEFEDNVIAANGRHGIKLLDNGSENTSGWSNLFQRNQIYANDQNLLDGINGLGIDLDQTINGVDATDDTPDVDPNDAYGNFAQNAPIVCTGPGTPDPLCGTGPGYQPGTGATNAQWTIRTRPMGSYRIEFFQLRPDGMSFLNEQTIATDASGRPTGPGCVAGLCASAIMPGSTTDTRGTRIVMTATDLQLADVPPVLDMPSIPDTPSNNTSEFSNAGNVPDPGELRFSQATYTIDENGGNVLITVQRVNGSDGPVSVNYSTANGTATAGADYATTSGTLSWIDQDSADQTFMIPITDDSLDEDDETILLTLANPTNNAVLVAPSAATLTITDNDLPPTVSVADISGPEGNAGDTPFQFLVTLSAPSGKPITVSGQTSDGSASSASDYDAIPATPVLFAAGDTSETVVVQVNGDTMVESNETFQLDLSAAINASIQDAQAQATILDDDASFSINDVSQNEGNAGVTSMTFTVTRTSGAGVASVQVSSNDGSATAGTDYLAIASTLLNFADGDLSETVSVTVNGDTTFEPTETLTLNLSNPIGGTIADGEGIGTITNDDLQPTVSISDVATLEGNAGQTPFMFQIVLSNPSASPISVTANTSDISAMAGTDYVAQVNTVIQFAPGETTQNLPVQVNGDLIDEANETFLVQLTMPSNASIADNEGQGMIQNDDAATSEFNISDVSQAEGNSGTNTMNFLVTRTSSTGTASVLVASSDGTASAGSDYLAFPSTPVNFADGDVSELVSVTINGDTTFESNETFSMTLSGPTNGIIADGSAEGTITNDDGQPSLSVNDVTATEGNAGTTDFNFTVSLSNAHSEQVTVTAATSDGSATSGSDYVALPTMVVTFMPGVTTMPLTVQVNGDLVNEPVETFVVTLTMPVNAGLTDGEGTGTIQNDDAAAAEFSINDVTLVEGNVGTSMMSFTVTRTTSSGVASIQVSSSDGTATAGSDYVAVPTTTLNFADGDSSELVSVTINGDTAVEADETLTLTLTNPTGGTIADGVGQGTITNDDTPPTLSVNDVTMPEGNGGLTDFVFTVNLSSPSAQVVSVDVSVGGGTATSGTDYQPPAPTTLTWMPGEISETLTVPVLGDNQFEADETFQVTLSNPVNATIADAQGAGTIQNEDIQGVTGTVQPVFSLEDRNQLFLILLVMAAGLITAQRRLR